MSRKPIIRNAQNNDIAALSELAIETYAAAFGHSFSEADLTAHLEKNLSPSRFTRILDEDELLVAEVEGRLIGYVQFGAAKTDDLLDAGGEIRRLYVHPEFQSQGYGGMLMETALRHPLLQDAASVTLDVWEHNHAAQRFYKHYGFEVIGSRIFEVESGAAASLDLIMVRRAISAN